MIVYNLGAKVHLIIWYELVRVLLLGVCQVRIGIYESHHKLNV